MSIEQILVVGILSVLVGKLLPVRLRVPTLFTLSILALFWLQPESPLQAFNWIFPLLSLLITVAVWWIVRPEASITDWQITFLLIGAAAAVGLALNPPDQLPPVTELITIAVLGIGALTGLAQLSRDNTALRKQLALLMVGIIAITLLLYKTPPILDSLSRFTRTRAGLSTLETSPVDWQWIGISYLSFRLMAVLLDYRAGRLPPLGFQEMLVYAIFPPALPAGPIDRPERFTADLRAGHELNADRFLRGGRRLFSGLFRKFVLADSLALVALSPAIAEDVHSVAGAWVVTYLYAFQIFFDFSGYTEIAIGLGTWAGIDLPENFNRPYLQRNLAQFWQNWHMTLTGWFRSYVFLPFTRLMLRRRLPISEYLVAQLTTMTLIALWHGVSGHFVLWGLWHALGLYAHHLLSNRTRRWYLQAKQRPWLDRAIYVLSVVATFHYVVIGWVFFVLPEPFEFLGKLFGI